MEEIWALSDAHTHLRTEKERREWQGAGILSLVCAVSPEEAEILLREEGIWNFRAVHSLGEVPERARACSRAIGRYDLMGVAPEKVKAFSEEIGGRDTREQNTGNGDLWQKGQYLVPACGIHPWYADRYCLEDMERWMALCPVIGEIGMDSVWCAVDLRIQEERFRQQLSLACKERKPVVLHTKGQEKEIADILREYPNRYLVHWYSCDSYLEKYLEMDCYFSVGPDVWWNPAVRQVAAGVPADRLLVETDGLDAVKWAYEEGIKAWVGDNMMKRQQFESGQQFESDQQFEPGQQFESDQQFKSGQQFKFGQPFKSGQPGTLEIDCQTQEIRLPKTEEGAVRSLVCTVETVARIRRMEPGEAARQMKNNLMAFISGIE